jgi:hypothetical protein
MPPAQLPDTAVSVRQMEPLFHLDGTTQIDRSNLCTEVSETCFLCDTIVTDDANTDDNEVSIFTEYTTIVNTIHLLILSKKGVEFIAQKVWERYNAVTRKIIKGETGKDAPAWHKKVIIRHLLKSPEFSELFEGAMGVMHRMLILEQNGSLVDSETKRVDPEAAKSMSQLLLNYDKHLLNREKLTAMRRTERSAGKSRR